MRAVLVEKAVFSEEDTLHDVTDIRSTRTAKDSDETTYSILHLTQFSLFPGYSSGKRRDPGNKAGSATVEAFNFRRCHSVTVNFRKTRGKSNMTCEAHFIARCCSEEFRYDVKDHDDKTR